jgi:asparagine N-glycosylation enzyme membrane subunit Stt3
MQLSDFIRKFRNHPVLFVGTGMSLRYLENLYSWDDLLKKICFELKGNNEYYHMYLMNVFLRKADSMKDLNTIIE